MYAQFYHLYKAEAGSIIAIVIILIFVVIGLVILIKLRLGKKVCVCF
jgi:hypothetical protein